MRNIKGGNRKMFRQPGLARRATGILASSPELMGQVEPVRMQAGGDPLLAQIQQLQSEMRDLSQAYNQTLSYPASPFRDRDLENIGERMQQLRRQQVRLGEQARMRPQTSPVGQENPLPDLPAPVAAQAQRELDAVRKTFTDPLGAPKRIAQGYAGTARALGEGIVGLENTARRALASTKEEALKSKDDDTRVTRLVDQTMGQAVVPLMESIVKAPRTFGGLYSDISRRMAAPIEVAGYYLGDRPGQPLPEDQRRKLDAAIPSLSLPAIPSLSRPDTPVSSTGVSSSDASEGDRSLFSRFRDAVSDVSEGASSLLSQYTDANEARKVREEALKGSTVKERKALEKERALKEENDLRRVMDEEAKKAADRAALKTPEASLKTGLDKLAEAAIEGKDRKRNDLLIRIGLNIAAGKSPDALTNIAEGTLKGLDSYNTEVLLREKNKPAIVQTINSLKKAGLNSDEVNAVMATFLNKSSLTGSERQAAAIQEAKNTKDRDRLAAIVMTLPGFEGDAQDAYEQADRIISGGKDPQKKTGG